MNISKKMWILVAVSMILIELYYSLFPVPATTGAIRFFAMAGFLLLCISLIIGPLVVFFPKKFALLLKERRLVGVLAFILIAIHFLLVIVVSYKFNLIFLTNSLPAIIAIPATLIFFLLACTSFDKAIRKMGFSKWKLLQRFTYPAFILSFAHFALNLNGYFIKLPNGDVFVNIAEVILILLGVVTIILQIAGFLRKRKMIADSKKSLPAVEETSTIEEKSD